MTHEEWRRRDANFFVNIDLPTFHSHIIDANNIDISVKNQCQ